MLAKPKIDPIKYLARIDYRGEVNTSVEALTNLQHLHLLHVPFENLDIHLGREIDLSNTFEKIVNKRRGGICYELNGLFFQLLQTIGFDVKLISARVYRKDNEFSPEFDHMAIIATAEGKKYLVDVGFGEFAYSPVKIELELQQSDREGTFMMTPYEHNYICVGKMQDEKFIPEYIYSDISRRVDEFLEMCHYHQTSPLSHFTQNRICSMLTETGRVTITGNKLKIKKHGTITEDELASEDEFNRALWNYFKVRL